MTPDIIKELEKEEESELATALLKLVKDDVKGSRSKMSRHYDDWDYQDQVYRGELELDKEDRNNQRKGRPTKMTVPNTFAQVMTFSSFLFLMYNQNRTFFELSPTGDEDYGTKNKDCEKILERDLRHNSWNTLLYQHLLDIGRFGPGIIDCSWTRKIAHIEVPGTPVVTNLNGVATTINANSGYQDFVKYEGNQLRAVSPYRFFPDTTLPLTDFTKGAFCAVEEEFTMGRLLELEAAGEVAGVDFIQPLPRNMDTERGAATRSAVLSGDSDFVRNNKFDSKNKAHNVLVTKVQRWIVPHSFTYGDDRKLGPQEFPILYHIWYANDNRVIRAEPAGWWHNEFGYVCAQFTPDMHRTLNLGLADLIYRLQDVISWFVNSHITSVRRVMQNRLIIDPRIIDTSTLDGEKDIYLRKGVSVPLEKAVGQLRVQDVTSGHMADVDVLGKIMEVVTGVNGNAMGQYNSGRRSAQEARVVTAGAAGRMKLHGHLIWESSLGRLGRLMLSNSRQSLSEPSYKWAIGNGPLITPERFAMFKGTPEEIVCGDDFMVFDSTLSSEKGFMAQSLSELFQTVLSVPGAAQAFDIDPKALLDEIQYLRGGGSVSRFSFQNRLARGEPMPPPQPLPNPNPQPAAQA